MKPFIGTFLFASSVVACGGGGAVIGAENTGSGGALSSISAEPAAVSVAVGASVALQVEARNNAGQALSGATFTYQSQDNAVATVDAVGVVRGVAPGVTTVTVNGSLAGRVASTEVPVTVGGSGAPPPPAIVTTPGNTFSPATVTISAGGSVTWQVSGNTHNVTFGANKPVGGDVPNTPSGGSATRVFTVVGSYPYECGLHSGMTGTVIVQGSGVSGQFASLALTPLSPFLRVGESVQLSATPLDELGAALQGLGAPTFSSSATGVATVSQTGLVQAIANGSAFITASLTANGITRTASTTVTVGVPAAVVNVTASAFTPDDVDIGPGGTVVWQFAAPCDVTFEDDLPPGGNIPSTPAGVNVARTFPTEATYDYECSANTNLRGRIRVR